MPSTQVINLIESGNVAPDLLSIAQDVMPFLKDISEEDTYTSRNIGDLVDMFAKRGQILESKTKKYGGITETISSLKKCSGTVKSICMLAGGFHFHFIIGGEKEDLVGIVFVKQ